MIKLIDLNYHTHSNISNPEEVLELQKASIGFADFIKEKLSIQLIKHLNYESEKYINGVKYFEYQLGSDDFKKRVEASKFGKMKDFAKFDKGYIALQGDHGQVAFRNIKIRPIAAK